MARAASRQLGHLGGMGGVQVVVGWRPEPVHPRRRGAAPAPPPPLGAWPPCRARCRRGRPAPGGQARCTLGYSTAGSCCPEILEDRQVVVEGEPGPDGAVLEQPRSWPSCPRRRTPASGGGPTRTAAAMRAAGVPASVGRAQLAGAVLPGGEGVAEADPATVDESQGMDQVGPVVGELQDDVAAPRLPGHHRPLQPEPLDDAGQVGGARDDVVAAAGLRRATVAALVDRGNGVPGWRPATAATPSQSRAFEASPWTSRNGRSVPSQRLRWSRTPPVASTRLVPHRADAWHSLRRCASAGSSWPASAGTRWAASLPVSWRPGWLPAGRMPPPATSIHTPPSTRVAEVAAVGWPRSALASVGGYGLAGPPGLDHCHGGVARR